MTVHHPTEDSLTTPPGFVSTKKKIICLGAHTDDNELGCGGTIAKLSKDHDIYYVAFSTCNNPKLEAEVKEAVKILGVKELILYDYPVRMLNFRRQEILDNMILLRDKIKPDIIFIPSKEDVHQDHTVVTREAMRAFKYSSIIGYEMPWNNYSFETNYFVKLEERHIEDKIAALSCYKSQAERNYCNAEFIKSLARIRGVQINTRFAEAYNVIRWID